MPGIVPDCERIAAVRREWNLGSIRPFTAGRKPIVKEGANMCGRVVWWQIKLHGHALPAAIGVGALPVSRNVAGQDRKGIHANLGKVPSEPAFETRCEALRERAPQFP